MRHRAKHRQLSRTSSHRRAMLSNMATSLFKHGAKEIAYFLLIAE